MDPILVVLLYSSITASFAVLGALAFAAEERFREGWIGWANALAAGLMLGVAYVLTVEGLDRAPLAGALGAIIGIGFIYSTRAISGTADLDLNRTRETSLEYGYKVVLLNSLHSASEGVAIGIAMVVRLELGIFMALALGVHNIPEATTLCAVLRGRGVRLGDAVGLAVTTKVSQVLLAVVTFAIVSAARALFSWALGFAIGALIYLVMVDLLPESYRRAGHTSIALLTSVAMGVVVLLKGFLA